MVLSGQGVLDHLDLVRLSCLCVYMSGMSSAQSVVTNIDLCWVVCLSYVFYLYNMCIMVIAIVIAQHHWTIVSKKDPRFSQSNRVDKHGRNENHFNSLCLFFYIYAYLAD